MTFVFFVSRKCSNIATQNQHSSRSHDLSVNAVHLGAIELWFAYIRINIVIIQCFGFEAMARMIPYD